LETEVVVAPEAEPQPEPQLGVPQGAAP
jgi:hypothetical protein